MKILHLVTKRQYRGAEIFAATLSTELIALGHEITFAGLYKNKQDVLEVEGATNIDLIKERRSSFSPKLVRKIVELVKNTKPDIIQCNGSDTLKYMIAASYFVPKIPIIYRNISMISKWMDGSKSKYFLYQNIFERISHLSSVGDEAVEDFIRTFNFPKHKTSVIRRGIPLKIINVEVARSTLRAQLGLSSDTKIAMHVGNFSPEKNHLFLLDIFEKMKTEHPDIKLVCVGDGNIFSEIKRGALERGLGETVFFTGFQKEIPQYLSGADCFVLPSKVEGVPGVILEAGMQKVPSISTNVGGVKEVLQDGKTGFLIEDFNFDDFYNKIVLLTKNSNLNREMGENAFELVSKEFGVHTNAVKFQSLYQSLIDQN